MAITRVAESTDYWYFAIAGDPTGVVSADVAILNQPLPTKPQTADWIAADEIVNDDTHVLWADALASGANSSLPQGQPFYFVALLVGPFNTNTPVLTPDTYTGWVRLTGTAEQTILIAPVAATII